MHVIRIAYIQATIAALALCLVWQAREVRKAAYRLEALRQERDQTLAEVRRCSAHVEKLTSPRRITRLVEQLGLQLTPPPAPTAARPPAPAPGLQTVSALPLQANE